MRAGIHSISRTLSLFDISEAEVARKISGMDQNLADLSIRLKVDFPELYIQLTLRGKEKVFLEKQADRVIEQLVACFKDNVFSTDGESMAAATGRLLLQRHVTLAVAESCTGGLISHCLTNIPGSSSYFVFGGVTYADQAKMDVLGVSPQTLQRNGAVHEITVREMAAGVRNLAKASYSLATSGIAGPDGGTPAKPVGTVCIALATPHTILSRRITKDCGDRLKNKMFFAMSALDMLRRELQGDG